MNERLRALASYPMVRLDQQKAALEARGQQVFDFGTGDPREPTPAMIHDAFRNGMPEVSQYPKIDGLRSMRCAAAGYFEQRFGVTLDPDTEILPTQGSKEAIFHLPMVFVDHDASASTAGKDTVVYGVPAYPVFEIGAAFAQAQIHEVELSVENQYLLDPAMVPDLVLQRTALVFLNYPHNPSGQTMPKELFRRWVEARDRHGFVLVSDECYVDLYYEQAPHSLLEFGRTGCLAVHSLSKRSGMTGYRSGFVAGDQQLVAFYRRFRAGMGVAPTEPVQVAATVAWQDQQHVADRRTLFAAKRDLLLAHFKELSLTVYPGTSTLFLWVHVPPGVSDVAYAELLLQHGILVSPGSFFGRGQQGFFRLALVPSLHECRKAAQVWPR